MNTHNYEDLGDEYFQMLCQALLVREYPGVQCFPVGMPDGGRDAIHYDQGFSYKGAIVYQVKFAREPAKLDDPAGWICKAIDGEREKAERLASRGVARYVLMTNIEGSSHLDGGQMDRVKSHLESTLPIPAICLWRGDLDRRLENAYDLKLRYPAVLRGADLLRLLWEHATAGDKDDRRQTALNAYFSYNYREDSTVRFKQVDLVSKALLDLYIDVPVVHGSRTRKPTPFRAAYNAAVRRSFTEDPQRMRREIVMFAADGAYMTRTREGYFQDLTIGGADLLTDPDFVDTCPWVVLEGAPGQGKSTLTQYLAQLQRARLLERRTDSAKFPRHHRSAPVAIPFRMELRDLATWLKGIDPWAQSSERSQRHEKPRSLEGALAAHIERHSGGVPFDVADLNHVLKLTPTVLLLDALDEVADLDDRAMVVKAVTDTLARFDGNLIRPQVVITSRPTAIAGSPTFPAEQFAHLSLAPLDDDLALTYARKWARARRLNEKDSQQLPLTLREKMQGAHIAQLAKNTMQLSILLSLVQRRGASLPDKRTELYNAYFDIFLDREAEKSPVVRDNRDLLFDIHRFLGFHLHANAELHKTSGRIRHEDLKWLLRDYLTRERQPHDLVDDLLTGMVERFGALISRVQGQYEFEVQPLQEYFAARHLNDTAPSSPPGRERTGTKPDRFDGIAANPYWLNVTRFFAGCFSKGELADLAERVCDLVAAPEEQNRPFARSLCVALLQDWVFSQSPRSVERVTKAVFDDKGLAWATAGYLDPARAPTSDVLTLPVGGGAEYLVEICWSKILAESSDSERTRSLCQLAARNQKTQQLADKWYEELGRRSGSSGELWLMVGYWLGIPPALDPGRISNILSRFKSDLRDSFLPFFLLNGQANVEGLPAQERADIFRAYLSRPHRMGGPFLPDQQSLTSLVTWGTSPRTWLDFLRGRPTMPNQVLQKLVRQHCPPSERSKADPLKALCRGIPQWLNDGTAFHLGRWIGAINTLDADFGVTWRSIELGLLSASIRNPGERGTGGENLFNQDAPLPVRVRYARRKSSDVEWWLTQRAMSTGTVDLALWCAAAAVWADAQCLVKMFSQFDESLKSLGPADRRAILGISVGPATYDKTASRSKLSVDEISRDACDEALTILSRRFEFGGGLPPLLLDRMSSPETADLCLEWLISSRASSLSVDELVQRIRMASSSGASRGYVRNFPGPAARRWHIVEGILSRPWDFPRSLVVLATTAMLRRKTSYKPVSKVAIDDGWFENDADRAGLRP
jgi:hypothetical protein